MTPARASLLPDWPARMGEDMAALYLGVSKTTFRERVRGRSYPQPVREGGRLLWSRRQLDRFIDSQFGTSESDSTWDDLT
jgi:predicted DNA-binding transcriptional regulator AlpA